MSKGVETLVVLMGSRVQKSTFRSVISTEKSGSLLGDLRQMTEQHVEVSHYPFLPNFSTSLFINHPVTQFYVFWIIERALKTP